MVDNWKPACFLRPMANPFPFVEIPPEHLPHLGKADPGTRFYRRFGRQDEIPDWSDHVAEVCGRYVEWGMGTVSPGGAIYYSLVSRAGIYKAILRGKLTAFAFHVEARHRLFGWLGMRKREKPLILVPRYEAAEWGKSIAARHAAKGELTEEELTGWLEEQDYYRLEKRLLDGP